MYPPKYKSLFVQALKFIKPLLYNWKVIKCPITVLPILQDSPQFPLHKAFPHCFLLDYKSLENRARNVSDSTNIYRTGTMLGIYPSVYTDTTSDIIYKESIKSACFWGKIKISLEKRYLGQKGKEAALTLFFHCLFLENLLLSFFFYSVPSKCM